MKKLLTFLLTAISALALLTACGQTEEASKVIKVGATPAPHAEVLAVVKDILAEDGYELEIVEYTDYIQPNLALDQEELVANYFQHQPYLTDFNAQNDTDLVSVANVHFEPLGLFPGKTASLEALADGATVAVPNDTTNEARALLLLEAQGLITLNAEAGLAATINDITDNPKSLEIIEIEAAQIARSLPDVDLAVINGNYAIEAGLNAATDALASEAAESIAAETFANILVVKAGNEEAPEVQALVKAITDVRVRDFINEKYEGAVVPLF